MIDRRHSLARTQALAALGLLFVAACKPFSGPLPGDPAPEPYFVQHLTGEGSFPLGIDLGAETRDVYLTFVNPSPGQFDTVTGSITVSGAMVSGAIGPAAGVASRAGTVIPASGPAPTPPRITEFNQTTLANRPRPLPSLRMLERAPGLPSFDRVGDAGFFRDYDSSEFAATCRKVVAKDLPNGIPRTLNIWVEDDCWHLTPNPLNPKEYYVDGDMITALVSKFLVAGADNDIYDWVTAMLGPEWGPHGYPDLIEPNDEITIVLCDIKGDNSSNGGIVGYFYAGDNFKVASQPDSSERVMFTIDAVMYANPAGGGADWDPADTWPEEIYSTLAHEFQHMIHFYQRGVLRNATAGGDTWINEMASQVVEDLVADKMDVIGPRGVDAVTYPDGSAGPTGNVEGRLPLFNYANDISLTYWPPGGGSLENYSITYAFGAWLARDYGGALLMNRLMQCPTTGTRSIEDIVSAATGKTEHFPRILQRWSVAQLLSNQTDAPPGYRYNVGGWFTSTVGSTQYRLGSIDLYAYDLYDDDVPPNLVQSGPWMYTATNMTSIHPPGSVALYRAAVDSTGVLDWTLNMPRGLIATVLLQ